MNAAATSEPAIDPALPRAASFVTGLWLAYQVGWIEGLFLASQRPV